MRISDIVTESIVDGPGLRYVVFTQGCPHGCPGCHNPQTHDPNGGREISPEALVRDFQQNFFENPLLAGVTLSGGEPFLQAADLLPLTAAVRAADLTIWIYTGYTIEELRARNKPPEIALLRAADVLVDGRFEQALRTLERRFVGSSNQRIIERVSDIC